jgi:hypothetical protein
VIHRGNGAVLTPGPRWYLDAVLNVSQESHICALFCSEYDTENSSNWSDKRSGAKRGPFRPTERDKSKEMDMDDQLDQLHDIIVESEDLHADGMRSLKDPLTELVEHHNEQRAQLETAENEEFAAAHRSTLQNTLAGTAIAAAGGGLLLTLLASPAYASSSSDAQILQTAASIEVLAVNTYKTALTLPYIGGATANKVVTAFVTTTMGQHSQHLQAFNAALTAMGSKTQTNPDPAFVPVVNKAVASLAGVSDAAGALAVVGLALELENAATETYVNDCSMLSDKKSVALMASTLQLCSRYKPFSWPVPAATLHCHPPLSGTCRPLPAASVFPIRSTQQVVPPQRVKEQ